MSWRKLLPRPRWLPRAALMHPQRVVIAGFSLAMLLMFIVGGRDLYLLRERVLSSRQHELTLRALGGEAVFSAERSKLIFVRDYAQQLITLYDTGAAPADPAVERAFAQRNEPVWQMEVPLGDAPVVGAAPALLKGLEGFDRRDADLHADLYAARQLSHVLGLSLRLRDGDDPAGTVSYISSNGLYVTYPPLAPDKAPALFKRFSDISYYRDVLPERDASREIRWTRVYTQFESTQLRTTLSIPVYVEDRFRGVVAVDVALSRLRDLIGVPDDAGTTRFLMDYRGGIIVSSQHTVRTDMRWPDDVGPTWRGVTPQQMFQAGAGMRHVDGEYLLYQPVGQRGTWLLVETFSDVDVWRAVLKRTSAPLLSIWLALPLLMFVTLRVVTLLFRHYVAAGQRLQQLAETDPLTALANRRHFGEAYGREAARRRREHESAGNDGEAGGADGARADATPPTPLSMLMIDIDFFKRVNDRWGHASGDHVLVALADVLRQNLREIDLPARLGGEEFAVLLPQTTLADAEATAERLRAAVQGTPVAPAPDAPPPGEGDGHIHFTVSIGVAEAVSDDSRTLDAMLATADRRLYAAKQAGRNRVCAADAPAGSTVAPTVPG
ncbi:diguanylate cyclase [Cupriavidus sp.]|uniref:diguanylate cyclase n=1 Tax=Cupriavidus sp. TaxID=1873897 RepID=UPI0025C37D41|nr:diguanylate cyclase [Cupriavidus sp.]MCA3190142.1 diguanylate cyclase [Cupriavidus sp.]MCA3197593.1 diguanylate cyclase [Cupriavidus sp.]MCA3201932.1 diguanylate cyclase [Cupriavidus sp.]MCA3208050.1 diguanylate cyclase [Cupriavidus sp.]